MTKDTNDTIQEQLIAARRNQILDAAITVFADKGFHRATVRDVAKAAGVADGTIYNYFNNKSDLVLGILNRLNETEQRPEQFALSDTMDIRAFFRAYVRQRYTVLMDTGQQVFRAVLPEILTNAELRDVYYRQIIGPTFVLGESAFREWMATGKIKPFDERLVIRAIAGTFLGLLVLQLIGDETLQQEWDKMPDLLTDLLLNGLLSAEGDQHDYDHTE
jgi:TetR/AcrR family fatty acid metabolism transcriptional regulator